MGKIIIGCWDCDYCDTKKISGELRECPNCGHPRDKDVKFYMDNPTNYAANPDSVSKEPDWLCEHCGSLNPASLTSCPSCGAPRYADSPDYFSNQEKKKAEQQAEAQRRQDASSSVSSAPARKSSARLIIPLIIVAAVIALVVFLVMPKEKNLEIASCTWERNVEVETYTECQESGWSLPEDAYDVTRRREIYTYEQVFDHYETRSRQVAEQVLDGYDTNYTYRDLGNGHFEEVANQVPRYRTEYHTEYYQEPVYRQEPVYQTKYYYYIMRWITDHWETTSGADDEPYFAAVQTSDTVREGSKTEAYWVKDAEGNQYTVSYDIWKDLHAGQKIKAEVQYGSILEVK